MMTFSKRGMMLIILILGTLMLSGCAAVISKETVNAYNDALATFKKASEAGAKKCAPVQYATAEAYLALADHEIAADEESPHLRKAIETVKGKSLEAIKVCEEKAKPPAPPTPPMLPPEKAQTRGRACQTCTTASSTTGPTETGCTTGVGYHLFRSGQDQYQSSSRQGIGSNWNDS